MNWRAFRACVRREVFRGRRLLWASLSAALAALLMATLGSPTASALSLLLAGPVVFLTLGGPSADLGTDKLQGFLEFDRVLPIATRLASAGRLLGAAIRLTPIPIAALALLVAISREEGAAPSLLVYALVPLGAFLGAVMVSWTLLALNARWQFRRLWWVPMTLVFGPQFVASLLPEPAKRDLALTLQRLGGALLELAQSPAGGVLLVLLPVALPAAVFAGATLLFASGLERYRYDANVLGAMLGQAPKRELAAVGRGAVVAVTRLRLRISLEQTKRQLVLLGAFLILILVGPEAVREFSRTYVAALAAMVPGSVAFQVMTARGQGYLEGMQQLPHPARSVALGHLAAVAVMAIPGALILLVGRLAAGSRVSLAGAVALWAGFLAGAWALTVSAIWFKWRYALIALGGLTLFALGWLGLFGGAALAAGIGAFGRGVRDLAALLGALLPLAIALLLALLGVPLFARALTTYRHQPR